MSIIIEVLQEGACCVWTVPQGKPFWRLNQPLGDSPRFLLEPDARAHRLISQVKLDLHRSAESCSRDADYCMLRAYVAESILDRVAVKMKRIRPMKPLPPGKIASCTVAQLRRRIGVPIDVVEDREALAVEFANTILERVRTANKRKKRFVIIMPVGPTGQWRQMADIAAAEKIDLSRLCIVSMDEYLTPDASRNVPLSDPFSFTAFIVRHFAQKAIQKCGFKKQNWIVPNPEDTNAVEAAIKRWGGVDIAFAGIGLNGHIAFNEPPLASESWAGESFAKSPTRIIKLAETTKATNSIFGTGGDLGRVPDFAVTIGMKEILSARRIHVFLDWHWQRFVLRRTLLGPVSRSFPASFLQTHKDVRFTVTQEVATPHSLVPE